MNYVIVSEMRTGSSYLGELIGKIDYPYYNELFTEEICRRSNVLDPVIDERTSKFMLAQVFMKPDAGFKMIYSQATPQVWAALVAKTDLKIIHIFRDDILEQFASFKYLQLVGVSMARPSTEEGPAECWGDDGKRAEPDMDFRFTVHLDEYLRWARGSLFWRQHVWEMFKNHDVFEMKMADVFIQEKQKEVFRFLKCSLLMVGRDGFMDKIQPKQIKTPRPRAEEMFENFSELEEATITLKEWTKCT